MLYDVLYADPPWSYSNTGLQGSALQQYPTMSTQEIINLPVSGHMKSNSIFFLWVTFPLLPECLEVMRRWNFEYKTLGFNWIKENKYDTEQVSLFQDEVVDDFFGLGFYTRSNSEICLIGVRGDANKLIVNHTVKSLIFSPLETHSKKPDEARKRIEKLIAPNTNKLELFARELHDGWTCLGNEIDGVDIKQSLRKLPF